jgi:hypothetical protein
VALQALSDLEIDWAGLLDGLQGPDDASGRGDCRHLIGRERPFLAWLKLQMEQDLALYRSGYPEIFLAQVQEVMTQQSTLFYRRHFFEIGGMMLIGMALYRWGVLSGRAPWGLYLALTLVGLAWVDGYGGQTSTRPTCWGSIP